MRIAILMGITYESNPYLDTLPACKNDLNIIKKIIDATNLYEEKLILNDDFPTAYNAMETMTEFIENIEKKSVSVDEVFVYYSGHGGFNNDEFYYAWNDYSSKNPNTTSLLSSQVDELLRRLKAKLTVKFIDACQSGLPYIKDIITPTFQDCFFCFSCRKEQTSVCTEKNSVFTYSIIEAIKNCLNNPKIRYRDIKNYIADKFNSENTENSVQNPYFCSQGKDTDIFCEVTENLKTIVNEFFLSPNIIQSNHDSDCKDSSNQDLNYIDIIEKLDSKFITNESLKDLSENLLKTISSITLKKELNQLKFTKLITSDKITTNIPCYKSLCKFVDENCSEYFTEITYDHQTRTVKKRKHNTLWDLGATLALLGSYGTNESDYEWGEEPIKIPQSFYIRNGLSYDYISFKIQSRCKCITNKEVIFVPFYNNTNIYLVYSQIDYDYIGIEETGPISTKWKGKECNFDNLIDIVKEIIEDFQNKTFEDIKEYLKKEAGVAGGV